MKDILYIESAHFVSSTKNSIKIRNTVTDSEKYYLVDEISCIIFANMRSYFSASLIRMCLKNDIIIIFCDEKHSPMCVVADEYSYIRKRKKLIQQISLPQKVKKRMWQKIIRQKITNQDICLKNNQKVLSQDQYLSKIKKRS